MAQQLRILQSLWAMERRLTGQPEWPLQTQLKMIRDAGFDGAGVRFIDPGRAPSLVIARAGGRPSIPEAVAIEPRSRGVLGTPPSRGTTIEDDRI